MKNYLHYKIFGLFFVSIAILSSCEIQNNHEGNGNVTTSRRNLTNFDTININGVLDVYLKQGTSYRVEVVTDENLQDIVETYTENGSMFVDTKSEHNYDASQMDIYITVPDVKRIILDGVTALYTTDTLELTDLEIEKKNTGQLTLNTIIDNLTLNSDGIGNIELNGKGHEVAINNEMVGDINAFGFKVYNLNLMHDGTGKVEVFVTNDFDVQITGVGDVYCKGNPVNITNTGENITGHLYMVN
jgi:hypothetical protein